MTNWPLLISELESAGVGISKIALLCQCQYTQIKRYRDDGVEPRYSLGIKLLEVHESYIRQTRADIPSEQ